MRKFKFEVDATAWKTIELIQEGMDWEDAADKLKEGIDGYYYNGEVYFDLDLSTACLVEELPNSLNEKDSLYSAHDLEEIEFVEYNDWLEESARADIKENFK